MLLAKRGTRKAIPLTLLPHLLSPNGIKGPLRKSHMGSCYQQRAPGSPPEPMAGIPQVTYGDLHF